MSYQYSIPALIALLGVLIADEGSSLLQSLQKRILAIRDRTGIRNRLTELGKTGDSSFENFRIYQLSLAGALLSFTSILLLLQIISLILWILLAACSLFFVVLVTERGLNKRIERRKRIIESEFPAIVEMLTLAIGAGDSPSSAIRRIANRADGFLAQDFASVISEIEHGKPLHIALDSLSRKLASNSVRRFVDSLIISISRGTPLVETLAHSAQEARTAEKSHLLAAAGKSEIAMMIPVVFLILPISILFALFPSLASIQHISG